MARMLAMCGLDCGECKAYKATEANDDALRAATAAEWTKSFKHEFKPADIDCDGCLSNGRHIGYCGMCEARKCGTGRRVATCAECPDYACERLTAFFKMAPEAQKNLEARRAAAAGERRTAT